MFLEKKSIKKQNNFQELLKITVEGAKVIITDFKTKDA